MCLMFKYNLSLILQTFSKVIYIIHNLDLPNAIKLIVIKIIIL